MEINGMSPKWIITRRCHFKVSLFLRNVGEERDLTMKHCHTIVTLTYSSPPQNPVHAVYMKVKLGLIFSKN